ncbi:hypothetical protein [Oribacterium sp. WCC10]|uniref:hypothetical protein n=1 Tax=Oribacterium sp. WCC10 TaxID=1855343 RepID=UPI0008DFA4CC|nr:hypothetical protein [Oribacterium sp. WCC10]SFG29939.1 hypothetical protein SAMN05216356_10541 [Oribacterium sp. WCC10]
MLNKQFTRIEKAFLLVLSIILLCLVYYRFIYVSVNNRIEAADATIIEEQIEAEKAKAEIIQAMKDEVSENQEKMNGVVSTYDNFKAEASLLNSIFVPMAESYNFSFDTPVADNDTVRRNIKISFTAANYQICRKIIQQIHDSRYRCMIKDISLSAVNNRNNTYEIASVLNSPINCSLNVVFYETLIGAESTAGLDTSVSTDPNDYIGLGKADFSKLQRNTLETIAESIAGE